MKTPILAALGAALLLATAAAPASAGGYGHGFHGHNKVKVVFGHGHHVKRFGYGYRHDCFFKKVKVFGHYGWEWKVVRTCG